MTDTSLKFDTDAWKAAQEIWGKAGEVVPEEPDQTSRHYLANLQRVVVNFEMAKSVSDRDRNNDLSFDDLANQCRDLIDKLSDIDDIAFARLARALSVPADQDLAQTIETLFILETALRNTKSPRIPHKKQHEHDNFLVVLLAKLYEQTTDRKASVTTDPITNERKGPFVDFVTCFADHFLPEQCSNLNARAIQRVLKAQRDNPDPLREA